MSLVRTAAAPPFLLPCPPRPPSQFRTVVKVLEVQNMVIRVVIRMVIHMVIGMVIRMIILYGYGVLKGPH